MKAYVLARMFLHMQVLYKKTLEQASGTRGKVLLCVT